jgi:hypothetical protein
MLTQRDKRDKWMGCLSLHLEVLLRAPGHWSLVGDFSYLTDSVEQYVMNVFFLLDQGIFLK